MGEPIDDLAELDRLDREATPAPWEWHTSNSWRRIGRANGRDGGVLCPVVASDGHPDLSIREEDMRILAAARNALPSLLRAAARLSTLRELLGLPSDGQPDDVEGAVVALLVELGEVRASVEVLRATLLAARGEITRMGTDGGGFSCTVLDDIDAAVEIRKRGT